LLQILQMRMPRRTTIREDGMAGSLEGKVAVVTGASTGFGRGIAAIFARNGAKVVVGDLTEAASAGNFDESPELSTADLVRKLGSEAAFKACDVSRHDDVAALVAEATSRFGRLDIMVNNAGVYRGGSLMHTLSDADLDACWNVLVKGTWNGCQEALKAFLAQGGKGNIINVVSTAGLRGHAMQAPYNMAKAAQANLTRCIALEYAAMGVRANGICPTYMKTAMSRPGFESAFGEAVIKTIPAGRWGEVRDVAELALFLASDASDFITGSLIPLDGGETLGRTVEVAPDAAGQAAAAKG
jgi:NAD(P)-dependent dehydrogenase (short-subunit alcohol dehydrogenase family)